MSFSRDKNISMEVYERLGDSVFRKAHGKTADAMNNLLKTAYPDMGIRFRYIRSLFVSDSTSDRLVLPRDWGLTYGFTDVLSPQETSYVLVAALVAGDTPLQINWHLDGARRNGATLEEVKSVREMAVEVALRAGIKWKDDVPEVKEVDLD